jgi:hypothetical protein
LMNLPVSMSYRIAVLSGSCVEDETGVCDILLEFVGMQNDEALPDFGLVHFRDLSQ